MDFVNSFVVFMTLILMICLRGFAELVRTEQLVKARHGEDIYMKCELKKQKNVKQVTWRRVSERTYENMAAYSERYGSKINESFRKNVRFVETGLQECSIVIKGVRWSDESCYECLFNVFPDGAISGQTCLKIYELHDPVFDINAVKVSGGRILLLSCSATGNPAPEVSWNIDDTALENSTTFYTRNPNGTITVTKTAHITSRLLASRTQIKCTSQQEFGERKEIFLTIPTDDIPSDKRHRVLYPVLVIGGLGVCVVVGLILCLPRLKKNCSPFSPARNITPDSSVTTGLPGGSSVKRRQKHQPSPSQDRPPEHLKVKRSLDFCGKSDYDGGCDVGRRQSV